MAQSPSLLLLLLSTTLVSGVAFLSSCKEENSYESKSEVLGEETTGPYPIRTLTGDYLSGRFAQGRSDWEQASVFLRSVIAAHPQDLNLKRRAMALYMGSGHFSEALAIAHDLSKNPADEDASLTRIFLLLESFKNGKYSDIPTMMNSLPKDGIGEFISPLISAWAAAGEGKFVDLSADQDRNAVRLFHTILIADYLNDKASIGKLAARNYTGDILPAGTIERIADIFARQGHRKEAQALYSSLIAANPDKSGGLKKKLEATTSDAPLPTDIAFAPAVANPQEGLATALSEMSGILFETYQDSGKLFAQMALYLAPSLDEPRLLLSYMAASNGRYDEAINYLTLAGQGKTGSERIRIQRQIADFLYQSGKIDQAVATLRAMVDGTKDIDAQIQIGDMYRGKEDYKSALSEYDKAVDLLGGNVPQEYWQLIYARGMTNERLKNWDQAEKDLEAALAYEPDHPYILNYLGYSWADQGVNLDKAAEMVAKAVRLRPGDGYIVDSLGWVYYRMGNFSEAAKTLEQAIELLPYDPTVNDHLGDAYWQVGRKTEARFQWKRAISFTKEPSDIAAIEGKIKDGIPSLPSSQKMSGSPAAGDGIAISGK
jgi:tetratricopeptide (TPR) repeat protein